LLSEDIEYAALYCRLEVAGGCSEVAWDDGEYIV
jgi:hypothetical protein